MKKYLVTGGTGFIGSALVKRLVHDGHKVVTLDNQSRGAIRRIEDVASDIEMIDGDIRDVDLVKLSEQFRGSEYRNILMLTPAS